MLLVSYLNSKPLDATKTLNPCTLTKPWYATCMLLVWLQISDTNKDNDLQLKYMYIHKWFSTKYEYIQMQPRTPSWQVRHPPSCLPPPRNFPPLWRYIYIHIHVYVYILYISILYICVLCTYYVCVYIYCIYMLYACMHTYMHTYTWIHKYINACMHACIHTYISTYMHTTCIRVWLRV